MIKQVSIKDIEPFKKMALSEKLSFNKNTEYYGYFEKGDLLGFCGIYYRGGTAILKNAFVLPLHRKKGIYVKLHDYRMQVIKNAGIKKVEANLTPKSLPLHLKAGAKIVSEYKICTKVIYENL